MPLIIVDTEYTTWPGALESGWSVPGQHREIVQIGAIKVDGDFKELEALDIVVRPSVNPVLSDLFVRLTTITQSKVDTEGMSFSSALARFFEFCEEGRSPVICMNADEAVFRENSRLNDIAFPFQPSWHRLRPYLEKCGVDTKRNASGDLHKLTPSPLMEGHVHYALHDVRSMACWLSHAGKGGRPFSIDELPTGAPAVDPRSKNPPSKWGDS
jgi:inhibitor of KinA sporulation pathway (predicted exonuclease)